MQFDEILKILETSSCERLYLCAINSIIREYEPLRLPPTANNVKQSFINTIIYHDYAYLNVITEDGEQYHTD